MSFQPGSNNYSTFGLSPQIYAPHIDTRAPGVNDINYPIGKLWIDQPANTVYDLTSMSTSNGVTTATWSLLGSAGGVLDTLSDNASSVVTPSAGNIQLLGTAGQITTTAGSAEITFSLIGPYTPATYTAHSVLLGEGASSIGTVGPGSTSGIALIAQGAAADPVFGTVVVAGGGTGAVTLTGVLTGNGTSAVTANAVTNHGVLVGGASNAVSSLAVASTGTVLAGSTGANPAFTGSPSVSGSVTAGTTLTATLGAITATNGNLVLGTAGNKILSTSVATTTTAGANSFGSVTLASGTATVATSSVTSSSLVVIWRQSVGASTALGQLSVGTITNNTSFVINAATQASPGTPLATDASVVGWFLIN